MTVKPKTIPELFFNRVKASAQKEAVMWKEAGRWVSKTWSQLEQEVRETARGVSDWVEPRDIVCILSENRPEWWIDDLSILGLGCASAPICRRSRTPTRTASSTPRTTAPSSTTRAR